jgi:hypothetical protein
MKRKHQIDFEQIIDGIIAGSGTRLSLGIKTGKAYRAFQKAERREVRACR